MSLQARARSAVVVIGSLVFLAGIVGVGINSARVDAPGFYSMTASANTADIEIDAANAPLLAPQLVYASPSAVQAHLDSIGGSIAFAGTPFLGQTIEGVGGLVNGLGNGVLPPIPSTLPGYVTSSDPSNPSANASQGPYTLTTNSTATSSTATAGIAASAQPNLISSTATATSSVDNSGVLVSSAQSTTQPFAIGTLVQIGTVQANAKMSVDAEGNLSQTSSFNFGTISIAGITVGLTQDGLQLLGVKLPVVNLNTLNTLLSSEGISLELLPGSKTATSITSEGLQISLTKNLPIEGASGVIIILGEATAQLQNQSSSIAPVPEPAAAAGADTGAVSSGNSGVTGSVTTTPDVGATSGASGSGLAPSGVSGNGSTPGEGTSSTPAEMQVTARLGPDGLTFYLILMLVGLGLTCASRAASSLAVRRKRKSAAGSS